MPHLSPIALVGVILAGVLCLGLAGLITSLYMVVRKPRNTPRAWLSRGAHRRSTTVVCAGDSHTHASLSADYVAMLQQRLEAEDYEFINAGLNGNTSLDLLNRLDEIAQCHPDAVTVMIGTNDLKTSFTEAAERDLERNLVAIVSRLKNETGARVALLSAPPLGEDLAGDANGRVQRGNDVIRRVAVRYRAHYLPLNESLRPLMEENSAFAAKEPFKLRIGLLLGAAVRRHVLRQTWDTIANRNHLVVHTDQLHLNDRAGAIIADLIAGWLTGPRD